MNSSIEYDPDPEVALQKMVNPILFDCSFLDAASIVFQIATAIQHLHKKTIAHRDLKVTAGYAYIFLAGKLAF